ncbi:MAG: thioredoxin domain-containing protein [Candidatus Nanoarchaeia archaeon]
MAEEKSKEHEQEIKHESKTVTLKKSTLVGIGFFIIVALLVVSIFTGGFGIMKPSGDATNAGNTGNTGTAATTTGDTSIFANSNLYPSLGPSNAKATVVELADFQCIWCALASGLPSWASPSTTDQTSLQMQSQSGDLIGSAGNLEQLAQSGKIQFVFVPLSFLGQESVYAAEAGFCAADQGKFWQMHDAIFKASDAPSEDTGKYSKANLTVIAQGISGLDINKFNSCLNNDTDLTEVQKVMSQVQQAGFQIGTPQFFVNGKSVQPSWAAMQAAINAA